MPRLGIVPCEDSSVPSLGQLMQIGASAATAIAEMGYQTHELQLLSTHSDEFQQQVQELVREFIGPRFTKRSIQRFDYARNIGELEVLIAGGQLVLATQQDNRPRLKSRQWNEQPSIYSLVAFEDQVSLRQAKTTLDRFKMSIATLWQIYEFLYMDWEAPLLKDADAPSQLVGVDETESGPWIFGGISRWHFGRDHLILHLYGDVESEDTLLPPGAAFLCYRPLHAHD